MNLSGHTILITGGSSGIGMALTERFLKAKNTVIISGRRKEALSEMKMRFAELHTIVSDAGSAKDREALAERVTREFPNLDVLINNAGIQRKFDVRSREEWAQTDSELAINLGGPIHLSELLVSHLLLRPDAHIMNVSSGLAFAPIARMPVYCASKAALHSFTLSLRYQLKNTSITVTEIIPPAVKTNLGGSHDFGVELDEFADSVMAQLKEGREEISYGSAAQASQGSRTELDQMFTRMNT